MEATLNDHILDERMGPVQVLRMNRADKKNALTVGMYYALADGINKAQTDKKVRVTVITGSGDSFTAGNDLADFARGPDANAPARPAAFNHDTPPFQSLIGALLAADKPVIAAVNGLAIGVGVTMLLHCDLVYAADIARFSMPFVNLGAVPEAGSTLLMPRMMGRVRANELLLFGDPFTAQAAREAGIINSIFPAAELMANAMAAADRLAAKPPSALRATKQLLRKHTPELSAAIREEGKVFEAQLRTPEAKEALKAFAERRTPDFSKFD